MIININKQEGVKFTLYPDNQPHVNIEQAYDGARHIVICSINSSLDLMHLMLTANAIDNSFGVKRELHIPYLMGARFDRLMQQGDSIDLKVIADMINSLEFERVYLYDVHSDVSSILIKRSISITNNKLVISYDTPNSILICPDAGAAKKVSNYMQWNGCFVDVVHCVKERDLSNGNLTLKVLEPNKCYQRDCVVIDDLCDGGGTFIQIGQQINPASLTLIVTHGVFSKGYSGLRDHYDSIITSNSRTIIPDPRVKVIDILPRFE